MTVCLHELMTFSVNNAISFPFDFLKCRLVVFKGTAVIISGNVLIYG